MPVPQDQTAPVQVGDGQQALGVDQHAVRRGRGHGLGAAVAVAADHTADVAARAQRGGAETHAAHAHAVVSGFVLRRRGAAAADEILKAPAGVAERFRFFFFCALQELQNGRRTRTRTEEGDDDDEKRKPIDSAENKNKNRSSARKRSVAIGFAVGVGAFSGPKFGPVDRRDRSRRLKKKKIKYS